MAEPKDIASRSKSEELITFKAAGLSEKNSPKARVASADHRIESPIRKFTIRQSMDSRSFEIVGPDKLEDQNLEASLQQQTPTVKLNRISSPVKSSALEPHEMALISQSLTIQEGTYIDEVVDTTTTTTTTSEEITTTTPPTKTLNREMKNLQQSANSSKVLSNFLTNTDTPRRRKNKEESLPPDRDDESEMEMETESLASLDLMDKEIPLKHSPISNNESDSTIVLQDETITKRRKSTSRPRSRSRSRGRRSRHKSMVKMMNDELAVQSDKEENDENIEDVEDTLFVSRTFENRAPNLPPKPGWDSYCFKCHLDNAVLSLACSKCKCSYHRACVRPNPIPKNADLFVCPECLEIQTAEEMDVNKFGHTKIDQHMMKEMLMTILETIRTQTGRDFFENEIPFKHNKDVNPLIVTQISYKKIEERIVNFYYKSTEAFVHDMKQLEHNWTLVDKNKAKALKPVMKYIIGDINEMESCIHCYSSAFVIGNWFSAACKRPHLLVWAKLKGYPYWPAKVMSVDVEKQLADVRFFGAHDRAYIPTQHCLIYCEKDPNKGGKGTPTNNKKGIGDALKETEDYISNVSAIYGFEYASSKESLDPKNFQGQLEKQLPKLKTHSSQAAGEKDTEAPQKEKLTLKFIRTSDVVKSAEKASKVPETKRHPLYRVLSKADSTETEVVHKVVRRSTIDSQKSSKSAKRSRTNERLHSETSESNISTSESIKSQSKKTPRGPGKRKKLFKSVEVEPELKRFCPPTTLTDDAEEQLLEEIPAPKTVKRQRNRSRSTLQNDEDTPLIVTVSSSKIPAGTDEIHTLREDTTENGPSRTKNRSRSLHRSHSQDNDSGSKKVRRSSAHPTIETEELLRPEVSILRRRLSHSSTNSKGGTTSRQRSIDAPSVQSIHDFPPIEIKSEPTSDIEEIVETNQVTINDIAGLVADNNSKKKTILITSDNSNDSLQNQASRARKSFPNSISSRPTSRENSQSRSENPQIRAENPMICIPQVFSMNPEKSTPHVRNINGHTSAPASRRNSIVSTQTEPTANLPRLIPKPAGVFTQDGTNYQLETGAVSALFSENAHRMTDYFKSLLIDTIGAVSSGIPSAEVTLLRLENERLKLHAQKTKNEHNLTLERMKKEHMDEIRVLRVAYEGKLKKFEENASKDLDKAKAEIRLMCEIEKQQALDALKKEYKKTTWCSFCLKEARFYCCWNTSYCGPACQREHWQAHQGSCRNTNTNTTTTNPITRESPTNKRTTAPTVQTTSPNASVSNVVPTTSTPSYSNATMVIPMVRKPSINAVQAISTPISTPAQYEIRATPQTQQLQPSQIVMPANTVVHRFYAQSINHNNLLQQSQIRPAIISPNPPALVPTAQGKKVIMEKQKQQQRIQHIVQTSQPSLIVIPNRPNSPAINIISSPSTNPSVSMQNFLTAQSGNIANYVALQNQVQNSVATIVPVVSKPNNI